MRFLSCWGHFSTQQKLTNLLRQLDIFLHFEEHVELSLPTVVVDKVVY